MVTPGVTVEPQPVADQVVGPDQVGAETDLDRDPSAGRVLVAGQPEPLHLAHVVAEALAGERVVVEVRGRRSHRPEGERVARRRGGGRLPRRRR